MKKIISFINDLPRQWEAETPVIAKRIRNAAGILTVAVPAMYGTLIASGVPVPEWFTGNLWWVIASSALIAGIAGTKETGKDE